MMFHTRRNFGDAFLRRSLLFCSFFLISHAPVLAQPPSSAAGESRTDTLLDGAWKFHRAIAPHAQDIGFDDSAWDAVTLPHTWNALDGESGQKYYRGVGWYRTHYTPPADQAGRRLFLQFDAASLAASVYVNGALVGEHRGGFAAFRFDVTDKLHAGADNVIAVKVDNGPSDIIPLEGDFTVFGGLYRMAHVISTDAVHLRMDDSGSDGVFLTPSHVSAASADLSVLTELHSDAAIKQEVTVTATVLDAQGHAAATLSKRVSIDPGANLDVVQNTTLKSPHLWNGLADPALYHVNVELRREARVIDAVRQPLGFRAFTLSPSDGFSLNGQYLELHGVNKHQDALDKGWAAADAQQDQDFALIKELGANMIRLSHYQHSQHTLDLCDKNGLVIWAEIPLIERALKTDRFADNTRQQLTELIKQNYNHPSIFFWSISNEIGGYPVPLLASLDKTAHTLDPTRLTVLASNRYDYDPINTQTDALGYNRYFGWYYGQVYSFGPWADRFHTRYPEIPVGITEYGAGASIAFHGDDPQPVDHTEEYQAVFHEIAWRALHDRPFLWCKLIWNMFDFAVAGRREGDHWGRNDKGLVTYDRQTRKDVFYFYKSNWSKEPTVYITGRRYDNRFGATRTVKVYSSADTVNLVVNNVDLGNRFSKEHVFEWPDAPMNVGANTVVASATIDGKRVSDTITWHVPARRPDGGYTFTDAVTRLRLDAPKSSRRSGTQIHEWRASGGDNQIWKLVAASDGSYTIQNADTDFYLAAVHVNGGWTLEQQRAPASGPQTWRIEATAFGNRIINMSSGWSLSNLDYLAAEGMDVSLSAPQDTAGAGWILQPATPMGPPPASSPNHRNKNEKEEQ